jgi:hypothetical protein
MRLRKAVHSKIDSGYQELFKPNRAVCSTYGWILRDSKLEEKAKIIKS